MNCPQSARDLRLDFFRGLALICIFVDHVPGNPLSDFTLRNLGFSDASELFVFLSAYSAGLVYASSLACRGFGAVCRKAWTRSLEVYAAHLALLGGVALFAGWLGRVLDDPRFVQGLNVGPVLARPATVLGEALMLGFQPTFMNILPLYVVLLAAVPAITWMLRWSAAVTLALSLALWLVARGALSAWVQAPIASTWQFDPLAWQLLFVVGMFLGTRAQQGREFPRSRLLLVGATAYLAWAFVTGDAAWTLDGDSLGWPPALQQAVFPVMERTDLSLWRLGHLFALVYLVVSVLPTASLLTRSHVGRALILCGQYSLALFAVGVPLSVAAWAALLHLGDTALVRVGVNLGGFVALWVVAWALSRPRAGLASRSEPDASVTLA